MKRFNPFTLYRMLKDRRAFNKLNAHYNRLEADALLSANTQALGCARKGRTADLHRMLGGAK